MSKFVISFKKVLQAAPEELWLDLCVSKGLDRCFSFDYVLLTVLCSFYITATCEGFPIFYSLKNDASYLLSIHSYI